MKHKIACTVIVGDDVDQESWSRLIKSVEPYVDHIFVNYNGKQDSFPYETPTKCGFTYEKFLWVDDFSQSRNQALEMVKNSGVDFDWFFWLDSDDELINGDKIQDMLNDLDDLTDGVMLPYDYGYDTVRDTAIVSQRRERFLSTKRKWIWEYPIHEVAHSDFGVSIEDREEVVIRHHKDGEGLDNKTRGRNRRILTKALQTNKTPRMIYYMGNELFFEANLLKDKDPDKSREMFSEAKRFFEEFLSQQPFNDDAYITQHRIADIHRQLNDHNAAVDAELQNIKFRPTWPESWLGVAQSWFQNRNWPLAEYFADLLIEYVLDTEDKRKTAQVIEAHTENYTPYVIRGLAREYQGKFDEAIVDYKKALNNPSSTETEKELKKYLKRAEELRDSGPHETIKEQRKRLFSTNSDRSIAFVVPPTIEPWHPNYINSSGSGGAEHCVVELANRFKADDYRVVIFGNPGDFEGEDKDSGIEWWSIDRYSAAETFHTVVSSRWPMLFDNDFDAKCKLLWMHDVNNGPQVELSADGNRYLKPDAVVTLTNWHRSYSSKMFKVPLERFEVIGNGVDLEGFKDADLKRPVGNKMVFSSSPDRGVLTLLNYWPEIKEVNPDAELHVYYGWTFIDKLIAAGNNGLKIFRDRVEVKLEDLGREKAGIYWHNRVSRSKLHEELMSIGVWAYPTSFCETFCITALESQAAGVIPITSDLAALTETVSNKNNLIYGWPDNDQYKNDFISKYQEVLNRSESDLYEERKAAKEHASQFTWENAYQKWLEVIDERSR